MKTYYTVYKVTNKKNGKLYIGVHKTTNLDDDYMGSGKYLRRSQEKHGLEYFEKEILHVFDNPEEMYAMEAKLVDADFLAEENTYNLKVGGHGGFSHINNNVEFRRAKNRKAMLAAKANGAQEGCVRAYAEKMKDPEYRQKRISAFLATMRERYGENPQCLKQWKGQHHTDETKQKIGKANAISQKGERNSQYGTMWITNEIDSTKIKKTESISPGWRKGRVQK